MDNTIWIGLIAGLGIGSVIPSLVKYLINIKETSRQSQREDLEKRYKVIILLMYAAFDFENFKTTMHRQRPEIKNREDILGELKAEWYNMLLFASGETQEALHKFISNPDIDAFKATAMSMRKDLGRDDITHSIEQLSLN